jgi:hypothetical protein
VRLLVPVCVTARKRTAEVPGQQNPGDELIEEMQRAWINWDADCQPGSLHWLMLTGGLTSLNKVVKFGFRRDEAEPCLVVKSARVPESIPGLVREGQNLDLLARLPGGGPPNVPHLLFMDRTQETAAVGESVVRGNPLYTHLRKDNYRSWALKATAWLGLLVKPEDRIPRSDWWARIAVPAIEAFDRRYSRELGAGWIDRIKDRLLPLQSLPLAFEHRDFSPWNVLVTDAGELAVLDWEGGEPRGLPGMDLIYFMTFLAFFHDGAMETGNFLTAYRASQDPNSFTGSVRSECFRIYFDHLRHDPAIALPLRTLAWTIHSLSVFPRLGRQAARDGAAEPGLFIQLLGEELKGT